MRKFKVSERDNRIGFKAPSVHMEAHHHPF